MKIIVFLLVFAYIVGAQLKNPPASLTKDEQVEFLQAEVSALNAQVHYSDLMIKWYGADQKTRDQLMQGILQAKEVVGWANSSFHEKATGILAAHKCSACIIKSDFTLERPK